MKKKLRKIRISFDIQAGPSMMWFSYTCCRGSMRSLPAWLAQNLTFSQSINDFKKTAPPAAPQFLAPLGVKKFFRRFLASILAQV